jgi:hypothetical protein
MKRRSFSERMEDGQILFWIVAALGALAVFGTIYSVLAIGTIAGF